MARKDQLILLRGHAGVQEGRDQLIGAIGERQDGLVGGVHRIGIRGRAGGRRGARDDGVLLLREAGDAIVAGGGLRVNVDFRRGGDAGVNVAGHRVGDVLIAEIADDSNHDHGGGDDEQAAKTAGCPREKGRARLLGNVCGHALCPFDVQVNQDTGVLLTVGPVKQMGQPVFDAELAAPGPVGRGGLRTVGVRSDGGRDDLRNGSGVRIGGRRWGVVHRSGGSRGRSGCWRSGDGGRGWGGRRGIEVNLRISRGVDQSVAKRVLRFDRQIGEHQQTNLQQIADDAGDAIEAAEVHVELAIAPHPNDGREGHHVQQMPDALVLEHDRGFGVMRVQDGIQLIPPEGDEVLNVLGRVFVPINRLVLLRRLIRGRINAGHVILLCVQCSK